MRGLPAVAASSNSVCVWGGGGCSVMWARRCRRACVKHSTRPAACSPLGSPVRDRACCVSTSDPIPSLTPSPRHCTCCVSISSASSNTMASKPAASMRCLHASSVARNLAARVAGSRRGGGGSSEVGRLGSRHCLRYRRRPVQHSSVKEGAARPAGRRGERSLPCCWPAVGGLITWSSLAPAPPRQQVAAGNPRLKSCS